MPDFNPDFSHIQAGESSEFARKMLIEYLRQYAAYKGVSQTQIASLTGLHRSNVARIFSGRYSPEMDTFLKIAGALKLRIELTGS